MLFRSLLFLCSHLLTFITSHGFPYMPKTPSADSHQQRASSTRYHLCSQKEWFLSFSILSASATSVKVLSSNGDNPWNLTYCRFRLPAWKLPSAPFPSSSLSAPSFGQPLSLLRGNAYSSSSQPFLSIALI